MARQSSAQLWDRHSFMARARSLPPATVDALTSLIDFAEQTGSIEWGLKANRPLFNFRCQTSGRKAVSAFYVEISPSGKNPFALAQIEFDFFKLKGRNLLPSEIIDHYRKDLVATGAVPKEVIETGNWKFFRVERLRKAETLEKFKQAVLNLKEAAASA